jgi:hypothetical protein
MEMQAGGKDIFPPMPKIQVIRGFFTTIFIITEVS